MSSLSTGGERWHLHRGDALAFLATLPDGCIDAVITDPPYSSGGRSLSAKQNKTTAKYQTGKTAKHYDDFEGDHRDQRSWIMWCSIWLAEAWRAASLGAVCCLFTDWRMLPATTDALQAGGWLWRGVVPWDKTRACRPMLGQFAAQAEYLAWGSKGRLSPDRLDAADKRCLDGVLAHRVDPKTKYHVTGKPLPLMLGVMDIAAPGSVVLDPFAGSGTTGVAALRKGHRAVLCEMVPAYQAIIAARMQAEERGEEWRPVEAEHGQAPAVP